MKMFVKFFNFTTSEVYSLSPSENFIVFFQQTCVYAAFALLALFIITVLLVKLNTNGSRFVTIFNFIKYANILFVGLIFICVTLKFLFFLADFKSYSLFLVNYKSISVKFNYLLTSPVFDLNNSLLSDVIILLSFSSGLVCLYLLGEKNLSRYLSNVSIFAIFLVATVFMVYTTNLLVMFVGFECLFMPTLYFVYSHGYVQRVDKTLKILLYWTLCGAFLVLTSLAYLYYKYKTLHYYQLTHVKFTTLENNVLYMAIFLGFGVKVPVFPFHYWLTKIHVEAPAGFSIFLSGFLVKAAIFCFYYFNLIFETKLSVQLVTAVSLFGVVEASIKLWTQTDFKKLIAFATIQEMNLILYLLVNYQNTLDYSLILFILIHGWLSTIMFFLVDIIQKKTSSRNIVEISGLAYKFPEIKFIIWVVIILFSGFPLTVKFVIEWSILGNLILQNKTFVIVVFFVVVVVGVVGFAKQMIIILYGLPRHNSTTNYTLSKRDKHLLYLILSILVVLNFLNFFLG